MASRRLYNVVADKLARHTSMAIEAREDDVCEGIAIAARAIAQVFEDDNPRFNRVRFLTACGVAVSA